MRDRMALRRGASLFASDEDVERRRILQEVRREEKVSSYQQIIQQCEGRIRQYHSMEGWLGEVKQSGFESGAMEHVRSEVRARRLSFLTEQTQIGLLLQQSDWNANERRVAR